MFKNKAKFPPTKAGQGGIERSEIIPLSSEASWGREATAERGE